MRRGKNGAAVLVGQDAGLKGIDVAGRLNDLGLVHPDEGAEDGQVLGGIGALQGLDGLACHLGQTLAGDEGLTALLLGDDVEMCIRDRLTVGGSLLMERFFSVPGMGPLLTDAIQRYDLNVVQTLVIFYAVLGIAGVFLGDVLMMVIDPRITLTGKEAAR